MLFLSYAREDGVELGRVVRMLDRLGFEVWFDDALVGGQPWWEVILERIRAAAGVVVLVSPAMVRSEACRAEVDYAVRLGTPVLPVALGPVDLELLPPSLGQLHVQRLDGTPRSADRFAAAVQALPSGPPQSGPVEPPPVPTSVVTMLADRVRAASLDLDEQLALVVRLEDAIEQRADRRLLAAVLADLLDREDLYARVSRRLEGVRAALADAPPAPVPAPERAPVTLLARRPGRWSLRVGWTTLVVSIDGHQPTVTVDGEPILFTSRQRGVRTFLLPGPDGRPVDAALLWNGPDGSDGLRLTVDHVTAYGDGIHA